MNAMQRAEGDEVLIVVDLRRDFCPGGISARAFSRLAASASDCPKAASHGERYFAVAMVNTQHALSLSARGTRFGPSAAIRHLILTGPITPYGGLLAGEMPASTRKDTGRIDPNHGGSFDPLLVYLTLC